VHHDISGIAVVASSVGGLSSEEDTGVRVHGGLVSRNGLVELPHDDGLGVVEEVLADTGNVLDNRDAKTLQLGLGANTRVKEQARSVNSASSQDSLLAGMEDVLLAGLESNSDTGSDVVLDENLGDVGLSKDSQVRSSLITAEDRVDVGDRGAAATAGVGVVGDGEEASALGQLTLLADLVVEVVDDGNAHGLGAGLDPVLGQLVTVTRVDGVQLVAEVVNMAHHVLKVPALAALSNPSLHVMTEGTERDQGVVRRATTEDLGARVPNVAVAIGLLSCAIVVVEVTAEEAEPLSEVENVAEVEVGGASLDHENLALGEVGGEARSEDATSRAAADNDVVVGRAGGSGKNLGRHVEASEKLR
jgi:hypothetical protein